MSQIAFFKKDGSIEVRDNPGQERMEINAFNKQFHELLSECFKVIVNAGSYSYSYLVSDGRAYF